VSCSRSCGVAAMPRPWRSARGWCSAVRRVGQPDRCASGSERRYFIENRIDGVVDGPRPGAPRQVRDAQVEMSSCVRSRPRLGGTTTGAPPGNGRGNGAECDEHQSHPASLRLQPHRTETFNLSPDPYLIDKVRDIVGLSPAARSRHRLLRGREATDPGARPDGTSVAAPHRQVEW
jgi:hypothetical protein